MKTDAVRVARIQAETKLIVELLRNPVVELLAGIMVISYLNKGHNQSQSWLETITGINLAAGSEYAGLIAIIGLQQIAPLMPAIAAGGADLKTALPALLALGAAV